MNEPGGSGGAEGVRLQKVLAGAGLGSRRACEELIAQGRVQVDGEVVREQGMRVDPTTVVLHVDGMRVQLDPDLVTIALHKPKGVVSSMHDEKGRPDLSGLVADRRVFHVGRLDADSEGLLLLTNDGELAHRLAHPSYEVTKTYVVTVEGRVKPGVGQALKRGIELDDGPVRVDAYTVLETSPRRSLVQVDLHEGRNRIVRRMFDAVGHPVTRLVRTRIGPVRLGQLKPGQTRVVAGNELGALMAAVDL
ncbi:rRNA pseudouridine synthase [Actinotalea sp. M2MS4P-6]|uniref:pseudouridine synthase n=1 Tax=Actinotalea sp. M2MS4P-6 TaxID=2983762 RepID=UPI0021E35D56|nr:pseudouridine synthase [Actinotalea sp. M2MS4P-6]MCV2394677.1 rRNA pseudouridine synthase [Actinotalea sp. M2MS4P-6]